MFSVYVNLLGHTIICYTMLGEFHRCMLFIAILISEAFLVVKRHYYLSERLVLNCLNQTEVSDDLS